MQCSSEQSSKETVDFAILIASYGMFCTKTSLLSTQNASIPVVPASFISERLFKFLSCFGLLKSKSKNFGPPQEENYVYYVIFINSMMSSCYFLCVEGKSAKEMVRVYRKLLKGLGLYL